MALPTTITGIGTDVSCAGPFKSSGGNIYFVGKESSGLRRLIAMKATDPTSSFSAVGSDPNYTGNIPVKHIAAFQVSDVIHIVASASGGTTTNEYRYFTFDMSSDSWVITNEAIQTGLSTADLAGTVQNECSIVVRSDSTVVVLYNGARVANMGNSYARVVYARRASGGGWTTNVAVDALGTIDGYVLGSVLGASDRTQFAYLYTSQNLHTRALSSTNVLQTAVNSSVLVATTTQVQGVSFNNAGTQKICISAAGNNGSGSDTIAFRFDDANVPTITAVTVETASASDNIPVRIFNDSATFYTVFRKGSDSDLYLESSTDFGATWGSQVDIASLSVGSVDDNALSCNGNIFQRGSDFVIAYVVNDGGTLKYNEYVVRSVAFSWYPMHEIITIVKRAKVIPVRY